MLIDPIEAAGERKENILNVNSWDYQELSK